MTSINTRTTCTIVKIACQVKYEVACNVRAKFRHVILDAKTVFASRSFHTRNGWLWRLAASRMFVK